VTDEMPDLEAIVKGIRPRPMWQRQVLGTLAIMGVGALLAVSCGLLNRQLNPSPSLSCPDQTPPPAQVCPQNTEQIAASVVEQWAEINPTATPAPTATPMDMGEIVTNGVCNTKTLELYGAYNRYCREYADVDCLAMLSVADLDCALDG